MNLPVYIRTERIYRSSPKINVYYPVIYGMGNQAAEQKMNHAIQTLLHAMLVERGYNQPYLQEMQGGYEIKTNEQGILSLSLTIYSFTGGAHGLTIIRSLTFDTSTGRSYSLSELFIPSSNYVKVLSDEVRTLIQKWNVPLLDPPFKTIRPDQDFYIADQTLVVYFQLYEITAYVEGFQFFPIPIRSLANIITPHGPLSKVMGYA